MLVSEGVLKWVINFYPPLFFQRIWVIKFEKGFRGVNVNINKSFLNKNYNNSIFGGTIFSAADPFYPLLFYHILSHKGYKIKGWSRSAAIRYIKPGETDLHFKINISEEDIADCEDHLKTAGKYRKSYPIEIYDKNGILCVSVIMEMYIRDLSFEESADDGSSVGF
jgi:acyl-coenzyme A thioesterase PaaI-like protein